MGEIKIPKTPDLLTNVSDTNSENVNTDAVLARALFDQTSLPESFLQATVEDLQTNPEKLKTLEDFEAVYKFKTHLMDFKEAFSEFATNQVVSSGAFRPTEAFEDWNSQLNQQDMSVQEFKKISANFVDSKAVAPAEQENVFDILNDLIDLLISMTDTLLSLSAGYAVLTRNETKKQEEYLEILNSLKTISPTSLTYMENSDSQDVADEFNTRNQVIIPGAQSKISNYNEMSQNEAQSLNTMVTALSDDSKTISDIISDLFSKFSTWGSSIMR